MAKDCLEVLAYMDKSNIFPREFPNFDLRKMPQYRDTAKKLLGAMGRPGAEAAVARLRGSLMGMAGYNARDVSERADFYEQLFDVLRDASANGDVTQQDLNDLREAAAGKKSGPEAVLAKKVTDLADELESVDILTALKWAKEANNGARKRHFLAKARERIGQADMKELTETYLTKGVDASIRKQISDELNRRIAAASILDLMRLVDKPPTEAVGLLAAKELSSRRPRYSEVYADLGAIWQYHESGNKYLVEMARWQAANAFQRAPMPHCLTWLGLENKPLNAIIWAQIDGRIKRADTERKAEYRQSALAALGDRKQKTPVRMAALDLLLRLNDPQAAAGVVEQLALLPRELWPKAGEVLRKITGQNFGPREGDDLAAVSVALKQWREWIKLRK